MKVGIDSVLLGSWASVRNARKILDVGTGCGILALMCAQRNPFASILGIDVDEASVNEAEDNFKASPWSDRLSAEVRDYHEVREKPYDFIISNPPYFNSGRSTFCDSRDRARHQSTLSPKRLLSKGAHLLSELGIISMIFPYAQIEEVRNEGISNGLFPFRIMTIRGRENLECKRVMMEFKKGGGKAVPPEMKELVLEDSLHYPTRDFRKLCKDFYLKF